MFPGAEASLALAAAAAFWLGLLTALSPCPLASNLAAVAFIARDPAQARRPLLAGLAYTLGRSLTYLLVAWAGVAGLLALPGLAMFMQEHFSKLLGPVFVVAGVALLDVLPWSLPSVQAGPRLQRLAGRGVVGPLLLGMVLALGFCPVSAGLFFGSLLPLAVIHHSPWLLPAIFGLGTGLPVAALALVVALAAGWAGRVYRAMDVFQAWGRRLSAVAFVAVGLYLTWQAFSF